MILKHSSDVCGCALAVEKGVKEAGLPENVFRAILVPGRDMDKVIAHPLIKGVTFTGSENVGRKVAAMAGQHLKKVVLELGGSDLYSCA